ncbi:unnamed protein product [Pseudo-nitzschia multistriata]|uniref:Sec-independent protein translocase protein TatA n=1 Tax=Pseudo-nitzschia multistriata TaxID=183589 RepID=A0A448ZFG9_9STRA|nr:unnamed protein product [Pseudo-nitzschia multistriata]
MPLIHSASPSQKDQSFASQANDQKVKHSLFQRPANNVLSRHRRSVANVQTMGLFGLGAPEIAIILAAGAFVIGPEALGNMLGSAAGNLKNEYGDLPNELKKIPEEFQKGFEESTENAKARNAKQMEVLPDEDLKKYIDRNP